MKRIFPVLLALALPFSVLEAQSAPLFGLGHKKTSQSAKVAKKKAPKQKRAKRAKKAPRAKRHALHAQPTGLMA